MISMTLYTLEYAPLAENCFFTLLIILIPADLQLYIK